MSLILRGAPLHWPKNQESWSENRTPQFPIVFSIASGFFLYLPGAAKAVPKDYPFNLTEFIIASLIATIVGSVICVLLNLAMKASYTAILKKFSRTIQDAKLGSQRILYFSSFYQIILFLIFSSLCLLCMFDHMSETNTFAIILLFLALVIRLLSVFLAMKREANGSFTAGLLSIIPCLDAWWVILFYILY